MENNVWKDPKTDLEWQIKDFGDPINWFKADDLANTLGAGWRLPTAQELIDLFNRIKYDVLYHEEIPFRSMNYWTSTTDDGDNAYYVDFLSGHVGSYSKVNNCCVRCVWTKIK